MQGALKNIRRGLQVLRLLLPTLAGATLAFVSCGGRFTVLQTAFGAALAGLGTMIWRTLQNWEKEMTFADYVHAEK